MERKTYKYIKSNAFTEGESQGNPAACIYTEGKELTPNEMQAIAREHKGFVMEMVFCDKSERADCKLTYYSSECEVDFCGHGTIATMYSLIKENEELKKKKTIIAETNKKGIITIYNEIEKEDAVYISAPEPIEHKMSICTKEIAKALTLKDEDIDTDRPARIIDAGLRTLIVPIKKLKSGISVYPDENELKKFTEGNDIDIILIFTMETSKEATFAHTRVFAPRFGYLEDPATGSGNSAFANYMLSEKMWDGQTITIEQGGDNRIYNSVKLKVMEGKVLFGGRATTKIEGTYKM